MVTKLKKRKVIKWITEDTIKIAEERREAKVKYKKRNAEFQKRQGMIRIYI